MSKCNKKEGKSNTNNNNNNNKDALVQRVCVAPVAGARAAAVERVQSERLRLVQKRERPAHQRPAAQTVV